MTLTIFSSSTLTVLILFPFISSICIFFTVHILRLLQVFFLIYLFEFLRPVFLKCFPSTLIILKYFSTNYTMDFLPCLGCCLFLNNTLIFSVLVLNTVGKHIPSKLLFFIYYRSQLSFTLHFSPFETFFDQITLPPTVEAICYEFH